MGNTLNDYITSRYPKWVGYAEYHVRLSRLPIDPIEVVNDVLCALLERARPKLERLMKAHNRDGLELDFFVMRAIKINIISPRSSFRYKRGEYCTDRLEDNIRIIASPDADFDQEEAYAQVQEVFNHICLSELSKRVFTWRFFEGRPFSEWAGPESQKFLYEIFNRVILIISYEIRKKQRC